MIRPTAELNEIDRDSPEGRPRVDGSRIGQRLRRRARTSVLTRGEPVVWLTGGALVVCVFMIVGLLALVFYQGSVNFWPLAVVRVELADGTVYMGEVTRSYEAELNDDIVAQLSAPAAEEARRLMEEQDGATVLRRLLRTENFELTNTHFHWINELEVREETEPEWALVLERRDEGRFYGFPREFRIDGEVVASEPGAIWEKFQKHHGEVSENYETYRAIQKYDFGALHARLEEARLELRQVALDHGEDSPQYARARELFAREEAELEAERQELAEQTEHLEAANRRHAMVLATAQGQEQTVLLSNVVRAYPANQLDFGDKLGIYASRWGEFVSEEPRQANSEGGVFPAIVGTVVMTLLMSIAVVPFGVLAALYLREYAKAGVIISTVRVAINNLAGVPSIVFGVFGLGFFCYIVGGTIDELFFEAKLPSPTYGTGGVLWSSLTLALLTLPVVIVATEEAIAAVPGSMREGSYACGASKWQTIQRIVLPRAMPGIMTGFILAMARGAGEVAPLMLVGAVKFVPKLPIDNVAPYLHPERSYMHLGFHIYDVGFQSQNSEAAKPMVFTTTLLLLALIALLNIIAILVRNRLRRKFVKTEL